MTVRAHCMVTTFDPATNVVMTAATVNVYNPGTVTPISATMFDRLGNPLSNPLTSDATTGLIDFYLNVAQEVDLVVSKATFTTRTYSNVPVLDDSSYELSALLTTTGDMLYASGANVPARLPIGTGNYALNVTGGIPKWTSALQVSDTNQTVGIGGGAATATVLNVGGGANLTGVTNLAIDTAGVTFPSSATTSGYGIRAVVQTAAASFVMANAYGVQVATPTIGSGSSITSAYGVNVSNQGESGVTNAYGVYIAAQSGAATTNIALYNLGTTQLQGGIGVNTAPIASAGLKLASTLSGGVTELGIISQPTGDSSGTTELSAFYGNPTSFAGTYTVTTAACFHATAVAKGAGSTITSAYGLLIDAQTNGNTNNYGIVVTAPSSGSGENYAIKSPHIVLTGAAPGVGAGQVSYSGTTAAPGGGASATLTTIGGSGPTTAAQNGWLKINSAGTAAFIPIWT